MAHGKRYRQQYDKVDRDRAYPPAEAIALIKETASAKFDETVEVHFLLGVNVRHADEQLRGTLALPHGLGKDVTVAVFAQGQQARDAEAAGADFVGGAGPGRESPGGLDRLRRRDRDPGHDADGRPARPRARPAGQDAEPESRHRHRGRREGRHRGQGRQSRVPHRPPGDRPHGDRQGQLRRRTSCSTTTPPWSRRSSAPSPPRRRANTSSPARWRARWAPASASTPRKAATARPAGRRRAPVEEPDAAERAGEIAYTASPLNPRPPAGDTP